MDFKELNETVQKNWSEMKAYIDEQQAEIKKFGEERAEIKASMLAASSKINDLESEMRRMRVAADRPIVGGVGGGGTSTKERLTAEARDRYELYFYGLRVGVNDMGDKARTEFKSMYGIKRGSDLDEQKFQVNTRFQDSETKALSIGDETTGGYLAPPEFVQDIIKGVQLISPIRPLAQLRNTSRRSVQYPVRSGVFAAKWVSETGARTETAGLSYSLEEIPNHELYADVLVSDQDLEDAVFNLEQEILDNCTEQFAKAEGAAFINGTSNGQPEGILTNANVAYSAQGTGGASTLLGQGLIQIWGDLKTVYAKNATWGLNRASIAAARGLTDAQGRYLWEPGLSDGTPPNLLGSPYIEIPDMPNVAANAFPIFYGNLKRSYLIVDRINVVVRRLQEKYAESGQIAYLVRKRVGGQVVLPEAIRKLKISVA